MSERDTTEDLVSPANIQLASSLAAEVIECFGLSDLASLLETVRAQRTRQDLNVAVLGRFKAGKSSFINDLVGKPLLPVGVLPVTAVVTEIAYGEQEHAEIRFLNGETKRVPTSEVRSHVSESENPENVKNVRDVRVFMPALARYRGIRLVDTPGLDSIFEHNTETSLSWTPNVDLAVVAIAVDPPLTQQDIALIERLYQYTPNISVILTKIDILGKTERLEVEQFVRSRLKERFGNDIAVFPYSIKPGYEGLRRQFEDEQILRLLASAHLQRGAILVRKLNTLLRSAEDYLQLSEKAAVATVAEREELTQQVLGSREFLADQKLQLQLLARHAAGKTRSAIDTYLQHNVRGKLEDRLKQRLASALPDWHGSFARLLSSFEGWLRRELREELSALSAAHQSAFCGLLETVQGQCQRNLQSFRDQLSEKAMRLFGTPLRTSETEIQVQAPRTPDISVGKVFDHNWELASFLIPMPLVRWAVERRFYDRLEREVYKNLSRLTTQWEEKIQAAIFQSAQEAERRFEELIATIKHLLSAEDQRAKTEISSYLQRVREALKQISS